MHLFRKRTALLVRYNWSLGMRGEVQKHPALLLTLTLVGGNPTRLALFNKGHLFWPFVLSRESTQLITGVRSVRLRQGPPDFLS